MPEAIKIIIPMAGWATRLRPHTWSKPKPLVSVAGETSLELLLESFKSIPGVEQAEYTFITSPYFGELMLKKYMAENHPEMKVNYVPQSEMKGQSHALWLAREHIFGPCLVIYADTLIEADFTCLAREMKDIIGWVKEVPDPRRFGVAQVNADGLVSRLVEKPEALDNKLAVVGCYWFREGRQLVQAIEEQMQRGIMLKGEYFLTDTINILLEHGASMRTENTAVWLDTGTVKALLDTNRHLLEHGHANPERKNTRETVKIIEPAFIHETAEISNATLGPHVSIGAGCKITTARIENSILDAETQVSETSLKDSVIGRQVEIRGPGMDCGTLTLNMGDNSSLILNE